ncbi:FAD-binding oxidoreductase [Rhodospirillaceae bacterium KN72]|uniref:FAD-binding oxidoreductase n=1 Tax=Pacificispira spongiicola TaxID=2729598 RepID=A0A7Y0HCV0_9PROT|nr:FAD-binding oxidoreductase [Pacificispira spongiicola]NMM43101.1 FAD-binding oxidoreductase [Pacificispira spongiicola]
MDFIASLTAIVGARNVVSTPEDMAQFMTDVRRTYQGHARCVVLPGSTQEVSDVVKLCDRHQIPITPIGGNTGLVGGAIGLESPLGILLSLKRMNRVREISLVDDTITVDAGCVLQDVQQVAADADRLFPMSLSAEGSCQIGGNIATNSGGVQAIRYGVMRELVLGLEVVLPTGEILDGLLKLRKDNTGYDIRDLFIGSEGTLGIVTAAVLKLYPAPKSVVTAMLAVQSVDDALAVLTLMRGAFGERVTSFECTHADYMDVVLENVHNTRAPFETRAEWYLLVEVMDSNPDADLADIMETTLEKAFEQEKLTDAVIAQNQAQADAFWHLRHGVSEAIRHAGPNMSHDSSVPLDRQGVFAERARQDIGARFPECKVLCVAHLGDGNMHIVVLFKPGRFETPADYKAASAEIDEIIDAIVVDLAGSITAEHGIGLSYRGRLAKTSDPVEIRLMKGIKSVFDPKNIMNPGKLFLD